MSEPLEETVTCRACGHVGKSLARHLKAAHGITADEYRAEHGADALIRSPAAEARRRAGLRKAHKPRKPKQVSCTRCGETTEIPNQASASTAVCPACREAEETSRWEGKTEPEDFVTCLECGHRAENLTAHITHEHLGYRERHPGALVVALGSAVRDKSALRGRELSKETRQKMSENAGRWNAGLTKEDHPSIASQARKMRSKTPWNKGLSVESDVRIQEAVAKLKTYVGENRPWHNGLKADLTLEDFKPFMDAEGRIDRRAIVEATGLSWRTIFTYMQTFDLGTSTKYQEEAAEAQIIRLDKDLLEGFVLGNGKVSIARAMRDTGHSFPVIKRECERHGLETFNRRGQQTLCLDAVSEALGGLPYKDEWKAWRFTNPLTGHRFRFDGYFKDVGLIVEHHGHQHFMFPNAFMVDESYEEEWLAMRERDRVKRKLIEDSSDLIYMEVRYDEPFTDVMYLKGRLFALGLR